MKEKEIHCLLSIVLFITILFLTSIFCVEDMQIKKVSFDWYIWILIISIILLIVTLIVLNKNYTGETVHISKEDLHYKYNFESAKEIYIAKDVVNIPYKHFYKLEKLQYVEFEGENTIISENAFEGCKKLERVYLPSKLEKIRNYTFKDCKKLKNVTIPDSVIEIGVRTFQNCKKLEEITIPKSVIKIVKQAFKGCGKLENATFEDTNNWYYTDKNDYTGGDKVDELSDSKKNAKKLRKTHCNKYWYKATN